MNDLMRFEFGGAEVRTVLVDDLPWWVLADVCSVLSIGNPSAVKERLDSNEMNTLTLTEGNRGNPNVTIINESGLYSVILRSDKPEAKLFRKWVTSEVLPSIRKYGVYAARIPKTYGDTLQLAAELQKTIEKQEKRIAADAPKVAVYEAIMSSKQAVSMHKVAKMLELGLGRNQLFAFLRDHKVLMGDNTPYQAYMDRGYFCVKESHWTDVGGSYNVIHSTLVYQKGIEFIRELVLDANRLIHRNTNRPFRNGFKVQIESKPLF